MTINLQDFMSFLHKNGLIDLNDLLEKNEIGSINRLKLQKFVYLAQMSFQNDFGYEYNIYNNGPYSPELANYYYENLDLNKISTFVNDNGWKKEESFAKRFLDIVGNKDLGWLEVACTLIDSTNYCEDEQECLNRVYALQSEYHKSYIDNIWNELKEKNLVDSKPGLKLNNFLSIF